MYSLIVSVKDKIKLNSILLPSLVTLHKYLYDNHLPNIQLILVDGNESLTKNYNDGLRQSKWRTKFFIHEDVNIRDTDIPLFVRVDSLMSLYPNTGLVGLVGTTENPKGFWWDCTRGSIVGHVFCNDDYWRWNIDKPYYDVKIIDGIFMATNTNMKFSEDIEGFHLYDSDYCNKMLKYGYTIKVLTHAVTHMAELKDLSKVNVNYYNNKWSIK